MKVEARRELVLYALIAAGEMVRLFLPFFFNPIDHLWSDPARHWGYALSGIVTQPLAMMDLVMYQAWLSFVAKFTLDIPLLTAAYAGLMSAITPWVWYRFLRELLPDKRLALVGWAMLACLPSWIGIFSYFMTETLALPLLGMALWMSWRSMRKGDVGAFSVAVIVWSLAALTRGQIVPIAAAVTLFVWLEQSRKIASGAICVLVATLVIGGMSYRSYVREGIVAPFGHSVMSQIYAKSGCQLVSMDMLSAQHNLYYNYGFVSPALLYPPFAPFSEWRSARVCQYSFSIDMDRPSESWTRELDRVNRVAPDQVPLVVENVILLMFGPSWPDLNADDPFEVLSVWMRFLWAPAFILCVIALMAQVRAGDRRTAPALLLALTLWFVVQGLANLMVNEGRYRKPAEGLIIASLLLVWSRRRADGNSGKITTVAG